MNDMSGGMYNYLCYHADDLGSHIGDVTAMAERLEKSGYYGPARTTRTVLDLLWAARVAADRLADVWRAVEWADSGDSGEDAVVKAVGEFKPWPPEPQY